jgi:hypothetical protein
VLQEQAQARELKKVLRNVSRRKKFDSQLVECVMAYELLKEASDCRRLAAEYKKKAETRSTDGELYLSFQSSFLKLAEYYEKEAGCYVSPSQRTPLTKLVDEGSPRPQNKKLAANHTLTTNNDAVSK